MAYNQSYTDGDIGSAAIDGVVKVIIAFASLGTLIGFVVIYAYARKHMKG
jgi:hypothetical protein